MIPARYQNAKYEDVPSEIRTLFENIMLSRQGMYIWGAVGSGKTHIIHALKNNWNSKSLKKAIFWNTTELMREIRMDFDRTPKNKLRIDEEILSSNTLLFLDDIGAEKMSDFVAETFYLIINHRYEKKLPIIFTSNLPISDLAERVGDRIASRVVEMGDVVELVGKDRRMEAVHKILVAI